MFLVPRAFQCTLSVDACFAFLPPKKKKKVWERRTCVIVACTFWTPCISLSHRPTFCYIIQYDVRNFCFNTLFEQLANACVWANISSPNQRASEFCLEKRAVLWRFGIVCRFVFSRTFLYRQSTVLCCMLFHYICLFLLRVPVRIFRKGI
jgi:hypothetical protein